MKIIHLWADWKRLKHKHVETICYITLAAASENNFVFKYAHASKTLVCSRKRTESF